jgi:hypothetical protein
VQSPDRRSKARDFVEQFVQSQIIGPWPLQEIFEIAMSDFGRDEVVLASVRVARNESQNVLVIEML